VVLRWSWWRAYGRGLQSPLRLLSVSVAIHLIAFFCFVFCFFSLQSTLRELTCHEIFSFVQTALNNENVADGSHPVLLEAMIMSSAMLSFDRLRKCFTWFEKRVSSRRWVPIRGHGANSVLPVCVRDSEESHSKTSDWSLGRTLMEMGCEDWPGSWWCPVVDSALILSSLRLQLTQWYFIYTSPRLF
jgi:hypothetical protein